MPLYRSEFDVEAADTDVWSVLVDFTKYPEWNPSLPSISGELKEGATVSLTLGLPGKPPKSPDAFNQALKQRAEGLTR